ncbi:phosphate ABC transporter permease PstA [bacterium]|nr:phosphate ABC transporter permease PstA [bacterium]
MKSSKKTVKPVARLNQTNLAARGEPALWTMGGTLVLGVLMIVSFLILIVWNGITTFYPGKIETVILADSSLVAGEQRRSETYKPTKEVVDSLDRKDRERIVENNGFAKRTLYKIGNYDLYNEDFKWVDEFEIKQKSEPEDIMYFERVEWGPFIGFIEKVEFGDQTRLPGTGLQELLKDQHQKAVARRSAIGEIEKKKISDINYDLEEERLNLKKAELNNGLNSAKFLKVKQIYETKVSALKARYHTLQAEAEKLKQENSQYRLTLKDISGQQKDLLLSDIVRFYRANDLSLFQKLGIYFSRWAEFLSAEPREANTEGGVMPAIFGTLTMTLLLVIAVAPFGVVAALYLREYAKQGYLVSIVRICVNNLAGVPSIVYGVFGLGFFAYTIGGSIDALFYSEKLPNPTFGTGGLLWASLTLALLTVPVVIVATEEALAAVPQSLREGSLACGASKWQTIKNIVVPKALPGILTGLILAMARGAGEVAPLMLVGVVKMAPELPFDGHFPFVHLERSFMHLGFHIFDVGFQSRNAEAGKPMVFVTTLLLIFLVAMMNAVAIFIRNRLNRRFSAGHF